MEPWPADQLTDFELEASGTPEALDLLAKRRADRDRIPGTDNVAATIRHHADYTTFMSGPAGLGDTEPAPDQPGTLRQGNMIILANRLKWPAGALAVCQRLEAAFPDYGLFWDREREGYRAYYSSVRDRRDPELTAKTENDMVGVIAADIQRRLLQNPTGIIW